MTLRLQRWWASETGALVLDAILAWSLGALALLDLVRAGGGVAATPRFRASNPRQVALTTAYCGLTHFSAAER